MEHVLKVEWDERMETICLSSMLVPVQPLRNALSGYPVKVNGVWRENIRQLQCIHTLNNTESCLHTSDDHFPKIFSF